MINLFSMCYIIKHYLVHGVYTIDSWGRGFRVSWKIIFGLRAYRVQRFRVEGQFKVSVLV